MKHTLVKFATTAIVLALATTAFAGKEGGKQGGSAGKVSAVADGSITITNKKTGDHTFKTAPETKVVKTDGAAGALSDVKVGSLVRITAAGTAPDQAAQIQLVERKKKDAPKTAE